MGAVTDIVKRYVPASYRALVGATNSYDFSITELQGMADFVQYKLFSTVPGSANEATVWNPNELELNGVMTTLQFIPAAIDYWGNVLASESTTGTNENVAYFDRRPDLWKIYEVLTRRASELSSVVGVNINTIRAVVPKVSYGDNGRGILLSPDPMDYPPEYETVAPDDMIPWSYEQ